MSEPTQVRVCETCHEEYVSDAEWDTMSLGDCPDCVADDEQALLLDELPPDAIRPRLIGLPTETPNG